MSIDKAINQAPLGLNNFMDSEDAVEIEIIKPEGLTIGVDGVAVDLVEEEEEGFPNRPRTVFTAILPNSPDGDSPTSDSGAKGGGRGV